MVYEYKCYKCSAKNGERCAYWCPNRKKTS